MHISPILLAVEEGTGRVGEFGGLVEAQDHAAVLVVGPLETVQLPPLALIAPQVVHVERAIGLARFMQFSLHLNEPLAGNVDSIAA